MVILKNVIFFFFVYCIIRMSQDLKDLPNSLNQYFPSDQCTLLKTQAWLKDLFIAHERPVDFNVTV